MKITIGRVLMAVAVYEVVAYAFNSWQVSKPSAVGQAVFTLPFDFISTLTGGYFTATNPTGGVGAYYGAPEIRLPTRRLVN